MGPDLHVFKIDDGETHWVVAATDEDAVDALRESLGMSRGEYLAELGEEPDVRKLSPLDTVTITGLCGSIDEPGLSPELLARGAWSFSVTCDALAEHHERGLVCSSVY